ncbi:hypothetical protein U1Q18_020773, partial [Sarracenia purpurea var. burkii]
ATGFRREKRKRLASCDGFTKRSPFTGGGRRKSVRGDGGQELRRKRGEKPPGLDPRGITEGRSASGDRSDPEKGGGEEWRPQELRGGSSKEEEWRLRWPFRQELNHEYSPPNPFLWLLFESIIRR